MDNPYQTHKGRTGIKLCYLVKPGKRGPLPHPDGLPIIGYEAYLSRARRIEGFRLREGRGPGNDALVDLKYLDANEQNALMKKLGKPYTAKNPLEYIYQYDNDIYAWFDSYRFADDTALKPEQVEQYTVNACVLKATIKLRQNRESSLAMRNSSMRGLWSSITKDVAHFKTILKAQGKPTHTLPTSQDKLKAKLIAFISEQGNHTLIDGRNKNQSAVKVSKAEQRKLLEELIKQHQNLDNAQIAKLYNTVAAKVEGWKAITAQTVANRSKAIDIYTYSGRRGATALRNNKLQQIKRKPPTMPLTYWTLDGWDVELAFQQKTTNAKGHNVTTYHNRPAVVVVLDRVRGFNYPVGYAVGDHETPELIREALKNAVNHTHELFGTRYRTHQIQSDRYGNGNLTPFYEGLSDYYTPARAHNSKTKAIEPYFKFLNKQCQLFYPGNWTGFGVKSNEESQPNDEYLNKIRHNFPTRESCYEQVRQLIDYERQTKAEAYCQAYAELPETDRKEITTEEYLRFFGHTHSHTRRLHHDGFNPTLLGEQRFYESFDIRFRELAYMDWAVMYDPENLDEILVLNAKSDPSKRLLEIEGTHRFLLQSRHIQPEALYDRQPGDAEALARTNNFNKQVEDTIVQRTADNMKDLRQLFTRPELEGTLAKLLLVDSKGCHKEHAQKEKRHLAPPAPQIPPPPPPPPSTEEYTIEKPNHRDSY